MDYTKEKAFKTFCDEIAKVYPQYADTMRDNCLIVGAFNRAWEDSRKVATKKACDWLRFNGWVSANGVECWGNFKKAMEE